MTVTIASSSRDRGLLAIENSPAETRRLLCGEGRSALSTHGTDLFFGGPTLGAARSNPMRAPADGFGPSIVMSSSMHGCPRCGACRFDVSRET